MSLLENPAYLRLYDELNDKDWGRIGIAAEKTYLSGMELLEDAVSLDKR